jgi:two-component system nitrogen regulation response regulator GlnG/two-component system response regulator HydG
MLVGTMSDAKTLEVESVTQSGARDEQGAAASSYLLVLAWSAAQPARVGEALLLSAEETLVFGRGEVRESDRIRRVLLARCRPGMPVGPGQPLEDPFVSRDQLRLAVHAGGVAVVGIGKRPILAAGRPVTRAVLRPGETLEVKGQLLFVCVARPPDVAPSSSRTRSLHAFAEPDAFGMVGESLAAWDLRDRLIFCARREGHVLLLGPSGSGKELAAQAIHAGSTRGGKKLVARNAATFPSGLIDAELFGNAANYPNAGMAERPGLIGEADGSTLFLDEIGELPEHLQAHLLRVLDEGGEYQRLGDARRRKADLRLIAATNRPVEALKPDLAARLRLRLRLPGLEERMEDLPLLARSLLRRTAAKDHEIGERFLEGWDGCTGEPRISLDLMRALIARRYTTHVRELDGLLWTSLTTSRAGVVELTPEVRRDLDSAAAQASTARATAPTLRSEEITEEQVRAAMAKHAGVKERVWRELGLSSRYALRRLFTKYGIRTEPTDDERG